MINKAKVGDYVWIYRFGNIYSAEVISMEVQDFETILEVIFAENKYRKVVLKIKAKNAFDSKEDLIKDLDEKAQPLVEEYMQDIRGVKDILQFALDHPAPTNYALNDYAIRKAIKLKGEVFGFDINIEKPVIKKHP